MDDPQLYWSLNFDETDNRHLPGLELKTLTNLLVFVYTLSVVYSTCPDDGIILTVSSFGFLDFGHMTSLSGSDWSEKKDCKVHSVSNN